MLVLTRKQKESIKIGDDITITILRVHGEAVKVGIDAPKPVRVLRGELVAKEVIAEPTAEEATDDAGPQVIQFRFQPEAGPTTIGEAVQVRSRARGPLASLMSTLHTPGCVHTTSP